MWFTERTGIGRITSVGTITNFPIQSNGRPNDIIRGSDGALWFTTSTQVGRITTAGHITTWSIPGAKSLSSIVAAPGGGFWLADEQASTIRRFTPAR
jgi:virginiamycin B lyase